MSHHEYSIHRIGNHPRGGLQVVIEPDTVDPDRAYGAQLQYNLFTPAEGQPDTVGARGTVYIDGILGDPEGGERAMLALYADAQRANRRRRVAQSATTTGVLHEAEGYLYVETDD